MGCRSVGALRSSSVARAAWARPPCAGCTRRDVVIADLADEKGKELAAELGARYMRTDATNTDDVQAALAEVESLGPLRISVDAHGGPASGGRLVGKDGSPLDLDGFKTTIDVYLTGVFNVMRLAGAAMARKNRSTVPAASSSTPHRSLPTKGRSVSCPTRRRKAASSA